MQGERRRVTSECTLHSGDVHLQLCLGRSFLEHLLLQQPSCLLMRTDKRFQPASASRGGVGRAVGLNRDTVLHCLVQQVQRHEGVVSPV